MQYSALVAAFTAVVAVKAQDSMSVSNSTATDVTDVTSSTTDITSSDVTSSAADITSSDVMTTAAAANDTVVSSVSADDRNVTTPIDTMTYDNFASNATASSTITTREAPYAMNGTVYWNSTSTRTTDDRDRDHRSTSADSKGARTDSTHYVSGAGNTLNAGLFGAAFAAAAALLF